MSEMSREGISTPPVTPALGPGDADPRSQPRGTAAPVTKALGPGDDDPTPVDRGQAHPLIARPGPGDGPEAAFDMLVVPSPSPGSPDMPVRRITVFPKKQAAASVVEAVEVENQPRRERRRATKEK